MATRSAKLERPREYKTAEARFYGTPARCGHVRLDLVTGKVTQCDAAAAWKIRPDGYDHADYSCEEHRNDIGQKMLGAHGYCVGNTHYAISN
jgi:hypothetical protein